MLKISGTLNIRTIHGRNGPFNVGRLVTEIGEFSVKDTLLDQYEEGKYEGDFGISRIYPSYYLAGGRLVVEVRATLETLALAGIDELDEDEEPVEPDPIEEPVSPVAPPPQPAPVADEPVEGEEGDDEDPDARLFGSLWPIGERVKLDPTVDRALFRRQKDRLKALGYQFKPLGQFWEKPAEEAA
ncbi:MAG TPA: DUF3275 family protein [Thiotrichales bacterium]|nr:DUF3275 family protein [Thiotrichales bacterium]